MKLVFVAIFLMCGFLVSSSGEPQKHAPRVAQCRSDAAAWNKEEDTRQYEMMDCVRLDGGVRTSYRTICHVYTTAMYAGYQHFLERHELMEKFLDEESKGSR